MRESLRHSPLKNAPAYFPNIFDDERVFTVHVHLLQRPCIPGTDKKKFYNADQDQQIPNILEDVSEFQKLFQKKKKNLAWLQFFWPVRDPSTMI
jgi:hypothetical protein